jgi:CubicO group peptidase (beta-lactamase class C family)
LLSHSSGLGSYFNQTYIETSKNNFRELNDYKPLIKNETLLFEPGTDSRYSNTGMLLLGVVIEHISGQDYFSYIRKHIYNPIGMKNSDSYEMDQPVPNLAIGYEPSRENETGWNNNLYKHVLKGGPAGGGFSTVVDLHQFALAVTQYKLLSKDMTEQMYSAKPELHSDSYGYGFFVGGTKGNRIVGHGGGFEGISSNLDIYLDRGYVSAVMSNYGSGARPIENKIRELLARVDR